MFNESEKEKISSIRDYYGLPNQILKTCEELSELSTALLQQKRWRDCQTRRGGRDYRCVRHAGTD